MNRPQVESRIQEARAVIARIEFNILMMETEKEGEQSLIVRLQAMLDEEMP
jgi:hypothetical protein